MIQFLNKLYAEYLVLEEQIKAGLISNVDSSLDDIDLLAKIMILQEERPDFYNKICLSSDNRHLYTNEIDKNMVIYDKE